MSHQNWETMKIIENNEIFMVKVNVEIGDALFERKLVLKMKDDYPWVVRPASSCSSCVPGPCVHGKRERFLMPLHVFVWIEKNGVIKPEPNGQPRVIHHKNEDKCDARIKNLALGTQGAHVRLHNSKRRRHALRKREVFHGMYRPHQPAQVVDVAADDRKNISPPPIKRAVKTITEEIYELEKGLKRVFESVVTETAHLDGQGRSIPRSATVAEWRRPDTRLLGLRMPRMACSEAEACFVRLYALLDLDLSRVAEDLDVREGLLRFFLKRVPVAVAVERWVKYRRLPTKTVAFGYEEVTLQPGRRTKKSVLPTTRRRTGQ